MVHAWVPKRAWGRDRRSLPVGPTAAGWHPPHRPRRRPCPGPPRPSRCPPVITCERWAGLHLSLPHCSVCGGGGTYQAIVAKGLVVETVGDPPLAAVGRTEAHPRHSRQHLLRIPTHAHTHERNHTGRHDARPHDRTHDTTTHTHTHTPRVKDVVKKADGGGGDVVAPPPRDRRGLSRAGAPAKC